MSARKLVVFLSVLLFCCTCSADSLVGKNAPQITIREWITDDPPDISGMLGSVYVVEFWAMWCHPCVQSVPHLIAVNDKYKDDGLKLISLSQDKSASKVAQFVRDKGINYHVAIDSGTTDWFGVTGYPTIVVVNHLGKVVWKGFPWSGGFEKAIAKALAAGPPPLLTGVDLGPFKKFKKALRGGPNFAEAYNTISMVAANDKKTDSSVVAKEIVATIDRRINEKIKLAKSISAADPLAAYDMYARIVSRYDGIEIVIPAKKAYQQLHNYIELNRFRLLATSSATDKILRHKER